MLLGNSGAWIGTLIALTIVAGVFVTLVVLRDASVRLTLWDQRFLLWSAVTITIVLTILGATALLSVYQNPTAIITHTGHTLFHAWEIDLVGLGFSEDELAARLRIGYAWSVITSICYMALVLGGNLVATIRRLDVDDAIGPTADIGELATEKTPQRASIQKRIKSLFGPRRLAGSPVHTNPAGTA